MISESNAGYAAVENARRVQPDILLLDIPQDDPRIFAMIEELKTQVPSLSIIALTEMEDRALAIRLLRAGVKGYLSHRESIAELTQAVETVARGDVFLCPSASSALLDEYRGQGRARGAHRVKVEN